VNREGGGPGGGPGDTVDDALRALADALEERAELIARQVEDAYLAEIPEYGGLPPAFAEESYAVSLAGVHGAVAVLRGSSPGSPEEQAEAWAALGRRRARQEFPLYAVVHAFQVGMRVFVEHVAQEAPRFGGLSGPVVARAVGELLDVITNGIARVSEAYTGTRRQLEQLRSRAVDAFFSDLLLGEVEDRDMARAIGAGLAAAPMYAAVVVSLVRDDDPDLTAQDAADAAAAAGRPGSLWGRVGDVGVLIVPVTKAGDASAAAEKLLGIPTAGRRDGQAGLVVTGDARPGLGGVRSSYEDAMNTVSIARRLDLGGHVSRRDVLVPSLLASSGQHSAELQAILAPLIEADRHPGTELLTTLRAFLVAGLSVHKAATALFVHRNTLRARVRRIEQVLDRSIAEHQLMLQLALVAHDLHSPENPQVSPLYFHRRHPT
jgi:sugar diacid utilization regulator